MPDAHERSEKRTVLIVDDDPMNVELLNELLREKYKVRLAGNGVQALKAARLQPLPHAILLDVMMPGMDGYEACARLKADDATKDIPVIFLSGKDQADDAQRGFDLGGADYITKPILPAAVLARVDTHVSLKSALDLLKVRDRVLPGSDAPGDGRSSVPPPDFTRQQVVLIVDDTLENVQLMNELLRDTYKTRIANNGERALKAALQAPKPDLILLDIMMPGMDGYEVCRRLKADDATRDIPVIFLTAKTQVEDERLGFDVGCVDYITKPISPPIVLARAKTHLTLKTAADFLKDKNAYLESEVQRRTHEVQIVQDVTIMAMASLAETRDNETGNHIRRTQNYVRALADELKENPRFARYLSENTPEMLYKSAPLHDIGKVGVPDAVLLKPGKLTAEEFAIMKTHTTLGRDAILAAEKLIGVEDTFLRVAREIAYCHQEKWDGSGYPQGLAGEAIPISARLMALADVYDALISARVYKPALSHEEAVEIIRAGRATHFDPAMVDAFLEIQEEFRAIAKRFMDAHHELAAKAHATPA